MERFEHGGDIYAHPGVLDFSASLNPLGMPSRAVEALRQGIEGFACYPDPRSRELTASVAAYEQVEPQQVLVCAGATDALTRLCQVLRPSVALVCAPCYAGYEQALQQVGAQVRTAQLREEDGFAVTSSVVAAIDEDVQLVFLANPNNPTGRCLACDVLLALLERARAAQAIVALDECFIDLTQQRGSTDLLARFDNLVIVKAFTKSFALAGLRLGYALSSNVRLLDRLRAAGQPWAVSVPAQLAGVACLAEEGYLAKSRALLARERERLSAALEGLGFMVVPSEVNYLLFKDPAACGAPSCVQECGPSHSRDAAASCARSVPTASRSAAAEPFACERADAFGRGGQVCPETPASREPSLYAALLARGILVRSCANFAGLDSSWYRVAVRSSQENDCLLQALREVVEGSWPRH